MVGASKILTVSYGTFSCTLEGFDDPFATMRGIAEYFRDLAADDRYFGAEPPTPDAEMLHRIAEREVKRRVEAQVGEHGITLRQLSREQQPAEESDQRFAGTDDDEPAGNMFADIGVEAGAPAADADDEAEATEAASLAGPAETEAAPGSAPSSDDNSVAAKLSRIRAVVSRGAASASASATTVYAGPIEAAFRDVSEAAPKKASAGPAAPAPEATSDEAEADHDAAADAAAEEIAAAAAEETAALEESGETDTADLWNEPAEAILSEEPVEEAAEPLGMTAPAPEAEPAADTVAAEAAAEAAGEPEEEAFGEEAAAEAAGEPEEAATQADIAAEPPARPEAAEAEEASVAAEAPHEMPIATEAPAAAPTAAPEMPETPESGLAARIVRLKRAALGEAEKSAAPVAAEPKAEPPESAPAPMPVETPAAEAETPATAELAGEDADALFAEFDAEETGSEPADGEPAAETPESTAPATPEAPAEPAPEDQNLFDEYDEFDEDEAVLEDEAALEDDLDLDVDDMIGRPRTEPVDEAEPLQAEEVTPAAQPSDAESLAAMKAAIAAATSAIEAQEASNRHEAEAQAEEAPEAEAKQARFDAEESGDAAFDRILGETNSRMDDTEGSRRRSAIAHLKAAVAATKADRLLKRFQQPEDRDAEEQSQYRDDLAQVVRPNRPAAEPRDEATERPKPLEEKTTPLMLVSSLRVDEDDSEEAAEIAPRRVASETLGEDELEGNEGFREFAEKMGATELPDLLEAAAAYSAFVEGRKEFSRPQLMRRVASVENGEFSREAGLRSFGQLLRQGKIQKLKRGQFTVTQETRFNPEQRIAGE